MMYGEDSFPECGSFILNLFAIDCAAGRAYHTELVSVGIKVRMRLIRKQMKLLQSLHENPGVKRFLLILHHRQIAGNSSRSMTFIKTVASAR